jgi:hypothetical protein
MGTVKVNFRVYILDIKLKIWFFWMNIEWMNYGWNKILPFNFVIDLDMCMV